uniref:Uncharacterized protein n=1 Tax=Helianthus annuus TaxID=4232 RepID=A0A251TEY9_HELAN
MVHSAYKTNNNRKIVVSCIQATEQTSTGKFDRYGNGSLFLYDRANFWKILEIYTSEGYSGEAMKPDQKYLVHQLLNIILWTVQIYGIVHIGIS